MEEKELRSGYTTGTCAAAAAWAAVRLLCSGFRAAAVEVLTPGGQTLAIPIAGFEFLEGKWALCSVKKDAGDDPDVTNGVFVYARVSFTGERPSGIPCYSSDMHPGLYLTGGEGVGTVTRKGLSCPVGYHAINPVPRMMIFEAADEARQLPGRSDGGLLIEISIPGGKELAAKTFNPNLGITGGLSVLGTTGIVNPMSEAALTETIRLDIRVRVAEGRKILAVAPGNYGERFVREELELDMSSFVKCSNFIGDTFGMMAEEKVEKVLLAGHLGKMIKVAGGVMNTHSKYGDRRMEILADCAAEAGMPEDSAGHLYGMNTTDEAADYLAGEKWLRPVMEIAAKRVKKNLESRYRVHTEVVLFNGTIGILAMTAGAKEFAMALGNEKQMNNYNCL
ncbi:cobalt-precorrin-5B (C(1))-methyltransferase CbiD [Clostridium transplantifaecale]|uniref:cobalt-precorrin-5B (C(1))-methyltransferase CbiD n=1 Tax=Clostridium transplantifaecale TaxID=2479838 RepID=UPI000F6422F4|nr:cobalt-precorrin-5B (C(1))-methyltransferase CbiD [Clostridium transplantifaecale]